MRLKSFFSFFAFLGFISVSLSLFGISIDETVPDRLEGYEPWFTGPLLAGTGVTVPKGMVLIEPYVIVYHNNHFYNDSWKSISAQSAVTFNPILFAAVGLTSFMDIQYEGSLISNYSQGQKDTRIGDTHLGFGFQVFKENLNSWRPYLRVVLHFNFPTGHYKHLNPKKEGTDISGNGFYEMGFGLNFQKMFSLKNHFLSTRCNFIYKASPPSHIEGLNVYGGGYNTRGKISSVQFFTFDFAFEYSFFQPLVFSFDLLYEYRSRGKFSGRVGTLADGAPARISCPTSELITLAPALEYNFSKKVGIIAGSWFSVAGKNALNFASGAIALNWIF